MPNRSVAASARAKVSLGHISVLQASHVKLKHFKGLTHNCFLLTLLPTIRFQSGASKPTAQTLCVM